MRNEVSIERACPEDLYLLIDQYLLKKLFSYSPPTPSKVFKKKQFDAIFSISTFEHLIMPWVVVNEMNKVLNHGGLVFISTHQTFPLHDEPWDFWRYSTHTWHGLFNYYTGFEIVDAEMGGSTILVPQNLTNITWKIENSQAFLGSAVISKKNRDTSLRWDVDVSHLLDTIYPA